MKNRTHHPSWNVIVCLDLDNVSMCSGTPVTAEFTAASQQLSQLNSPKLLSLQTWLNEAFRYVSRILKLGLWMLQYFTDWPRAPLFCRPLQGYRAAQMALLRTSRLFTGHSCEHMDPWSQTHLPG